MMCIIMYQFAIEKTLMHAIVSLDYFRVGTAISLGTKKLEKLSPRWSRSLGVLQGQAFWVACFISLCTKILDQNF